MSDDEDRSYNWRVTHREGGDVKLDIGDDLSELSSSAGATAITRIIGEALIKLGTHLMGSRVVGDDDDDWDEED